MPPSSPRSGWATRLPWLIPAVFFVLVYATSFTPGYGYFIDEFYFLSCAARPDWGYVDHPPLVAWILSAWTSVFGFSLASIRIVPALAGATTVFLTGRLARRLPGAGPLAEALAALAMACNPVLWSISSFYSMNAFEPALALLVAGYTLDVLQRNSRRGWLLLGLCIGLGVLNKHTFAVVVLALVAGVILSGGLRKLLSRGALQATGVALIVVLPNLLWQWANDFPSLEFYQTIAAHKNIYTPPAEFMTNQLMSMNALLVALSLLGTGATLWHRALKPFRLLGFGFALALAFFLSTGSSRVDRPLFAYCWVVPIGAWWLAKLSNQWVRHLSVGAVSIGLAGTISVSIPLAVPVLSPRATQEYTEKLGINTEVEPGNKPPLPQLLADRIGWEKKAQMVRHYYKQLPEALRNHTLVSAHNYGKAAALEFLGRDVGLGKVLAPHNSFYGWSQQLLAERPTTALLHLGNAKAETVLQKHFRSVQMLPGVFSDPYVTEYEKNLRVYLCQDPRNSVKTFLEEQRFYY